MEYAAKKSDPSCFNIGAGPIPESSFVMISTTIPNPKPLWEPFSLVPPNGNK